MLGPYAVKALNSMLSGLNEPWLARLKRLVRSSGREGEWAHRLTSLGAACAHLTFVCMMLLNAPMTMTAGEL